MSKGMAVTFLVFVSFLITLSQSRPLHIVPHISESFKVNNATIQAQSKRGCTYTVDFITSCSSPDHTHDEISLAFGDAYGNEVYVPRMDDPQTFHSCSQDTFQITGPCIEQVCYLYVKRSGYDGWKPETITVYGGRHTKTITFTYNHYVPDDVWYGFDFCNSDVSATN
ncbi:Embryo-specific protein 3 (ATS3) [Euphorbia peplus]|nr:Embryo-specific protein 3 (ATS3) [Euphorbia peplus]